MERQRWRHLSALYVLAICACSQPTEPVAALDVAVPAQATTQTVRRAALLNPVWVKSDTLPNAWAGFTTQDCVAAGPDTTHFFDFRDAKVPGEYMFSYVVFPTSLQREPEAKVVALRYEVWQNQKWPDHYLLYDNTKSFKQIEIQGATFTGLHQTLDGKPYDALANLDAEYDASDRGRWAVDVENEEDYGTEPACDEALADVWLDVQFNVHDAGELTLRELILP